MTGLSGPEIYEQMNKGFFGDMFGKMSMTSAEGSAKSSALAHKELDKTLQVIQEKISETWNGKAADSARESLQPMYERTDRASDGMVRTEGSLRSQGENFQQTRDSLVEMKKGRDEYSALVDDATFGAVDAEMAKAAWDESNRHNIHQYKKYKEASDSYKEQLLKDFEADESSDKDDSGGSDSDS